MAELGNGLEIKSLQFSASGNIFMTMDSDFVSAVSTSAAGDWVETTFDFGEDSSMDVLNYIGGAGKELVTIYNFESSFQYLYILVPNLIFPYFLSYQNKLIFHT